MAPQREGIISRVQFLIRKIQAFQSRSATCSEAEIDQLFGIDALRVEKRLNMLELVQRYGSIRLHYADTCYEEIRKAWDIIERLDCKRIVDVGSGYGRLVLYGATLSPRSFVTGIEIVVERFSEAEKARQKIGLANAKFILGDASKMTLPNADCFCLLNGFSEEATRNLVASLRPGGGRPIFVSYSQTNFVLRRMGAMERVHSLVTPSLPWEISSFCFP